MMVVLMVMFAVTQEAAASTSAAAAGAESGGDGAKAAAAAPSKATEIASAFVSHANCLAALGCKCVHFLSVLTRHCQLVSRTREGFPRVKALLNLYAVAMWRQFEKVLNTYRPSSRMWSAVHNKLAEGTAHGNMGRARRRHGTVCCAIVHTSCHTIRAGDCDMCIRHARPLLPLCLPFCYRSAWTKGGVTTRPSSGSGRVRGESSGRKQES